MQHKSLDEWLSWQESLHPKHIDLGLERISGVLQQAGYPPSFACPLITVAGTNGKGSVIAILEAIALVTGLNVCTYTSPHLLHYNERIRINGQDIDDDSLCAAFERIDLARGNTVLTYFEFGTLAAIDIFMRATPDIVILEVGLGGRLDAVNIMQPDVAVVTTIAIDHTDWLGDDREAIGFEKAGIFRTNRKAICGDYNPPHSLLQHAGSIEAPLQLIGQQFEVIRQQQSWSLRMGGEVIADLPPPSLAGEFQVDNAATAIMAICSVPGLEISIDTIRQGLRQVRLPGRFHLVHEHPPVIVDVAHNPQAMNVLVKQLSAQPCAGKTRAVIAMLKDKPVAEAVGMLAAQIDHWYSAGLETLPRGMSARDMATIVEQQSSDVKLNAAATVAEACRQAIEASGPDDRIIVCGSFYTVADAMRYFAETMEP